MLMFSLGLGGNLIFVAWGWGWWLKTCVPAFRMAVNVAASGAHRENGRLVWSALGDCAGCTSFSEPAGRAPPPRDSCAVDCWYAVLALPKACRFCLLPLENDCWTGLGIGIQLPFGFWVHSKTNCKKNLTLKSKFGYGQPQILLTLWLGCVCSV